MCALSGSSLLDQVQVVEDAVGKIGEWIARMSRLPTVVYVGYSARCSMNARPNGYWYSMAFT
jgi:hypothetical protein